jgi:hypothetical protein
MPSLLGFGGFAGEKHLLMCTKDAASRTIRLVAIESWSCFSLWELNQRIISYVPPLPSNDPGRRTRQALPHPDPEAKPSHGAKSGLGGAKKVILAVIFAKNTFFLQKA